MFSVASNCCKVLSIEKLAYDRIDSESKEKAMSTFSLLAQKIEKLPAGSMITLEDLSILGTRSAVATALARMAKENILIRVRRGLYMKPKESRFGSLPPSREAMISAITQQGRKSYSAGVSAYNKLGLTTQVPNTFILRGGLTNSKMKIGGTRIEIKAGKSPKLKKDIPLMMILDSIREIKLIPDTTLNEAMKVLKRKVFEFDKKQKVRLVDLALNDKPVVRAILGAFLDEVNPEITARLLDSLNPLTSYKLGAVDLKFATKWKIK